MPNTHLSYQNRQMVTLDIGCGGYRFGSDVIFVDKDRSHNPTVVAECERHMPFKNNCIDTVTVLHTVEHVNAPSMLAEAYRVLKPNGRIYIETPNVHDLSILVSLLLWKIYFTAVDHVQAYGYFELGNLLRRTGFSDVRVGYTHYDVRHRPKWIWTDYIPLKQFLPVLWADGAKP